MSLANISIVGNLVRTPEQMCFPSGKIKTTLTVAVNGFGRPNRGGDAADFYRVEAWGKLAELAGKYLEKGNQVAVSGRLLFDRFVDQQGKNRVVPVVAADQLSLPPKSKASNHNIDEEIRAGASENMDPNMDINMDQGEAYSLKQSAAMSGHLVLEPDSNKEEIQNEQISISSMDSEFEAADPADLKVVAMDDKVKVRARRQAVLSS